MTGNSTTTPMPLRAIARVAETGSTNDDLAALLRGTGGPAALAGAVPPAAPGAIVLRADHQSAGHGRLDRVWQEPAGSSLILSIGLATAAPVAAWPWYLSALALAACETLEEETGAIALLKWPNDVLVADPSGPRDMTSAFGTTQDGVPLRKAGGLLASAVAGVGPVIGMGLNVRQPRAELPVATAVSIAAAIGGVEDGVLDRLFSGILDHWRAWAGRLEERAGDAGAAGLLAAYRVRCATLGTVVRVDQADGRIEGRAVDVMRGGHLLVRTSAGDQEIASGDVTRCRSVLGGTENATRGPRGTRS